MLLPDLTQEQIDTMDITDGEMYGRRQANLEFVKEQIEHALDNGDRYAHPFTVIDTDYDNYLLTYKCREEFRMNKEHDELNPDMENFRLMMEEFDDEKHPRMLAQRSMH